MTSASTVVWLLTVWSKRQAAPCSTPPASKKKTSVSRKLALPQLGAWSLHATCTLTSWQRLQLWALMKRAPSQFCSIPLPSPMVSMGTPGMRYSLVSREVIADSIETVKLRVLTFVAIKGCDKNMPACGIAIASMNRPSVFVYGGTILPGEQRRDIVSVFEAVGGHAAGNVSDIELHEVESTAIPGPGSCGGMYTANTMASSWRHWDSHYPAFGTNASDAKRQDSYNAGAAVRNLIKLGIKPSDILSRESFENAITLTIALEGSTNAVLHLLAIAHAAQIPLTLDDFSRVGKRVPVLADMRPAVCTR